MIDFGLAHALPKNQCQLTFPSSVPGSFHYTAPENFRYFHQNGEKVDEYDVDDDEVDTHIVLTQKADIWAAGIILFMMVHDGMHPYGTVGGGRLSKINALKSEREIDFSPQSLKANGLHESLKASLRKDPRERAEARELLDMDFLSGPTIFKS